jgi:protein-tyrosine phosphatase
MIDRILVVCVGNICRSPMAEGLLRSRLGNRPGLAVGSAGLAALVGEPADPMAQLLMRERGIYIGGHRARQLTPELATAHDLVLVMEEELERAVVELVPAARGRVHRLGRFGRFDVPDPYQRDRTAFEEALRLIERGIEDFERALWQAPRKAFG